MTKEEKKLYMRSWTRLNRERANEIARLSYKRNKHKHKERNRKYHLQITYNLSVQDYEELIKDQDRKCAICNKPFSELKNNPHIDHSHLTGEVRGILCGSCNTKLGWYENNKEKINEYIVY